MRITFEKAEEYDESGCCWWVNSLGSCPIKATIKIHADKDLALAIAKAIEDNVTVFQGESQ